MTASGERGLESRARQRLVVRVFWGARPEPRERCAARLASCLSHLRSISPLFETWKALGRTRSEARKEIETTVDALARRLLRHYTDVPREPIPSLGFRFGAWSGELAGPSANITVHCGGDAPSVSNSVVLDIDCDDTWTSVDRSVVRDTLGVLAGVWDAERGTAGYGLFHELLPPHDLDWMVYLGDRYRAPTLAEPTTIETLSEGRGSIITLTPAPPDLRREDDARLVAHARQALLAVVSATK